MAKNKKCEEILQKYYKLFPEKVKKYCDENFEKIKNSKTGLKISIFLFITGIILFIIALSISNISTGGTIALIGIGSIILSIVTFLYHLTKKNRLDKEILFDFKLSPTYKDILSSIELYPSENIPYEITKYISQLTANSLKELREKAIEKGANAIINFRQEKKYITHVRSSILDKHDITSDIEEKDIFYGYAVLIDKQKQTKKENKDNIKKENDKNKNNNELESVAELAKEIENLEKNIMKEQEKLAKLKEKLKEKLK